MKKFKQGDVVVLNSGGPKMTVKEYVVKGDLDGVLEGKKHLKPSEETSLVEVVWFENDKKKKGTFDEDLLSIVIM